MCVYVDGSFTSAQQGRQQKHFQTHTRWSQTQEEEFEIRHEAPGMTHDCDIRDGNCVKETISTTPQDSLLLPPALPLATAASDKDRATPRER
eukprot:scaffold4408_cov143-Isochrysis_galbana.AAC.6